MKQNPFLSRAINYIFKKNSPEKENVSEKELPRNDKEEKLTAPSPSDNTMFTPENVMRAIGVEILDEGGDGYYLVGFQGGAFVFCFDGNRLNVMYNDIVECSFSDSLKAAFVANDINGDYAVWSCYLRASKKGASDKPIKVCFSQMFPLIGDFKETVEFIHGILSSAFTVGREFRNKFKEALKDDSNLANTLNKKDFLHKLELTKRLIEVGNFDEIREEMPPTQYLRIDSLVTLFDDTEFGDALTLKTIVDSQVEIISEPKEIAEFDIRNFIRSHPKREELDSIAFMVSFEKQDLILTLKKMDGSSPKSLFFLLNVMRSGTETDLFSGSHSSISCRTTVEIRLTSEQEDYWEVKFMLDEARDKHNNNDVSSMTAEQKMMLIQLAPNVQDDFYWGIKFFNENCWYQSLFYFRRIFFHYSRPENQDARKEEFFADICLYIGITFYHLKMYDRAYYYLDRSRKYNSILASEWYVNCLCSMRDPMAYKYITKMIDTVSRDLDETAGRLESETQDEFYKYYLFLKRKLVQTLIDGLKLSEAESILNQMIENDENVSFSRNELDVIREIREEQALKSAEKITKQEEKNNKKDIENK